MIIGATNAGKSGIAGVLNGKNEMEKRKQDISYGEHTIDVPGAWLENPWMYRHIISAAQNGARRVLIVVNGTMRESCGSPGFAKVFSCPVSGVISKVDLMRENESSCVEELKRLGVEEPYLRVSVKTGEGTEALKHFLAEVHTDGVSAAIGSKTCQNG
jgi:ethanolamine utilization protein EutP